MDLRYFRDGLDLRLDLRLGKTELSLQYFIHIIISMIDWFFLVFETPVEYA